MERNLPSDHCKIMINSWINWIKDGIQCIKEQERNKANQRPAHNTLQCVIMLLITTPLAVKAAGNKSTTTTTTPLVLGLPFQCTMEKFDFGEHCVFRNVTNAVRPSFTYPADIEKPTQVTFVDCYMKQLPLQFLTLAGPELRVLRVESCGLESITITSGLEELYAKDNKIEQVIVEQSELGGSLRTLDLSGNQLSDVSDVTKFQTLEVLNISGNKLGGTFDLGKFKGLNKLRVLNLTNNDINYLDNNGNVNLESLEDLDLSHNNIITSDLDISIFYPYTKLHTLRLKDNYLSKLDYNYLLNIKSLKTIYLNGNNFKCKYLDEMLKHLNENGLQMPRDDPSSCSGNNLNELCCTGSLPTKSTPSAPEPNVIVDPTEPETRTTTVQPSIAPVRKDQKYEHGPITFNRILIGLITVIVVILVLIGIKMLAPIRLSEKHRPKKIDAECGENCLNIPLISCSNPKSRQEQPKYDINNVFKCHIVASLENGLVSLFYEMSLDFQSLVIDRIYHMEK